MAMANAAQSAFSTAVVSDSCSRSILLAATRSSFSISFLRSHPRTPCAAPFRRQISRWPYISAVSSDSESHTASVTSSETEKNAVEKPLKKSTKTTDKATLSAVIADVANLIKLTDTSDIVELELKNDNYELILKKKEALPPAGAPSFISPQSQTAAYTEYETLPLYGPAPEGASTPPLPFVPEPASPSPPAPTLPCILSPLAGTFYECPAPGQPPFVKVGDKVTTGQVVCIVEAMKLMNEIEAEQSGTIVRVLVENGSPVSLDSPLFVIEP